MWVILLLHQRTVIWDVLPSTVGTDLTAVLPTHCQSGFSAILPSTVKCTFLPPRCITCTHNLQPRIGVIAHTHNRGVVANAHNRGVITPSHGLGVITPSHSRGNIAYTLNRGVIIPTALELQPQPQLWGHNPQPRQWGFKPQPRQWGHNALHANLLMRRFIPYLVLCPSFPDLARFNSKKRCRIERCWQSSLSFPISMSSKHCLHQR